MVAIDREEQIRDILAIFEDRLTSPKPESNGSWFELSRMLDGASIWRKELNRRWGDRPDWKAFLEWEAKHQAARERKVFVRVGRWQSYVELVDGDNRAVVDWVRAGGGLLRGTAVRRGDEWVWSDEFRDSEIHQTVPVEGLHAVVEAARAWFDGPRQAAGGQGTEPVEEEQQAAG